MPRIRKLPHYLRTHRKRQGLSQWDVAFLMGNRHSAQLSRYEKFSVQPTLDSAIACALILREQFEQLFAGYFEVSRRHMKRRATMLLRIYRKRPRTAEVKRKIQILEILASRR